jgi:rfaE bifunctional protein kinase chain/domain
MLSLKGFSQVKVLVVGDIMLDRYWWGTVNRISPEAPVPIVRLQKSTFAVGGAANVAANIAGLGAEAFLVGLVGKDEEAKSFSEMLLKTNVSDEYLVYSETRPTTVKTRIIAHNQQVLRLDQEENTEIGEFETQQCLRNIDELIAKTDVVIISDYAKGLLTEEVLARLITIASEKNKPVLVDPKGKDYTKYAGATLLTPNRKEAAEACKLDESRKELIEIAGNKLISELNLKSLLITQGEDGMTLLQSKKEPLHLKASAREIFDVTGAGDTVIATLSVAIGAGNSLENSAEIANIAAGLVVEQVGTTAIKINELKNALQNS